MRRTPRSMAASVAMGLAKAFPLRVDQVGGDDGPSRLTQVLRLQKQGYPCRIMFGAIWCKNRSTLIATATAHALAWLVFLWLIFPRCIFGGVSPGSTSMVIGSCFLDYDPVGSFLVLRSGLADRRSPDLDAGFSDAPLVGHLDTGHSLLRCCGDMLGGVPWFSGSPTFPLPWLCSLQPFYPFAVPGQTRS